MGKALAHSATIVALLLAFFVAPVMRHVDVVGLLSGVDLTSSATTIQAAPSGRFLILINRDLHPDDEVLNTWVDFFEGKDVPLIWEDISCVALEGDLAGIDMAGSLQSRLPENQMSLRTEQAALALSKAEHGRFDVLVMSEEVAEAQGAESVTLLPNVVVVTR